MLIERLLLTSVATIALSVNIVPSSFARPTTPGDQNSGSAVPVHSQSTVLSYSPSSGLAGDRINILNQMAGSDGYTWYYVSFRSGGEGWVRGDYIQPTVPTVASNTQAMPHATVQTTTYAIKVYSQQNRLYMNVFNRQTGEMVVENVPATMVSSAKGISYTNQSKAMTYQLTLSPQTRPELAIRQGDRIVTQEYGF